MSRMSSIPYARIVSIFDLSRCRSSMIGRAVKAESMAPTSSREGMLSFQDVHQMTIDVIRILAFVFIVFLY